MLYAYMTNPNGHELTEPATFDAGSNVSAVTRPLTSDDIMEELESEILRKYHRNGGLKAFTRDLGVDYLTYRRYIVRERKMPVNVMMESFIALDIDPAAFFNRLRERLEESDPK